MTSWKIEVLAHGEKTWASNALRFATREEAEAYASDLFRRWTSVEGTRAVESDDAVGHAWTDGGVIYLDRKVRA